MQAGTLIRRLRLERGYSEAGLAHGICAASYLSKIEQGHAEPGADILDRLFAALGVTYCRDAALLSEAEEHLAAYYEAREREWDASSHARWLEAEAERLRYSDLCLSMEIWQSYLALDRNDPDTAGQQLKQLEGQTMDTEQSYRYLLACSICSKDAEAALQLLLQAARQRPCAMIRYLIAGNLYHLGQYGRSIEAADQAYSMGAEEGDLYVLIWSSFLLGSCYTAVDMGFAEKYYRRSIRLGSLTEPMLESWVAYNLGASYLEWGDPEKALFWLNKSRTGGDDADRHDLLLFQKRALACIQLNRREEAEQALREAEQRLCGFQTDWERRTYTDMVRFARLLLEDRRDDGYETLLKRIYAEAGEQLGFGFRRFYSRYLIELYRSQRRYKDALGIMAEMRDGLS